MNITHDLPANYATAPNVAAKVEDLPPAARIDLATRPSSRWCTGRGHPRGILTGYVVRQTIEDGRVMAEMTPGRPGRDVLYVPLANRYAEAIEGFHAIRAIPGAYAVADSLYSCGCRS